MPSGSHFRLVTDRRFAPLFYIQLLAGFSTNLLKIVATITIVYGIHAADPQAAASGAGLAAMVFILPRFAFASLAGQLGDKMDKARLARVIRGLDVPLMILAAAALHLASYPLLLLVLFLAGMRGTFYSPLKYSILPRLLERRELLFATGLIQAAAVVAVFAGQVAGAIAGSVLAGLLLVALALAAFILACLIPATPREAPDLPIRWNLLAGIRDVLGAAWAQPRIRVAILGISWLDGLGAVFASQFAPLVRNTIGGRETVVSLFLVAFALGTAIGAVAVGRLLKGEISARICPYAALAIGVFTLDLWWAASAVNPPQELIGAAAFLARADSWRMLLDCLAIAAASAAFVVPLYTMLQVLSAAEARSRNVAANNLVNAAAALLLTGLASLLLKSGIRTPALLLALGLVTLVLGGAMLLSPRLQAEPQPSSK